MTPYAPLADGFSAEVSPAARSRVTVDLGGLLDNIREVKSLLAPGEDLLPVIKSNAYGHGIIPVSRAISHAGIPRVAVMGADEASLLRESGHPGQIVLLGGFSPGEISLCRSLCLTPVLHHSDQIRLLELSASDGKILSLHLKIDSGMGRLGFLPEELPRVLDRLGALSSVRIEGLMTHFPVSEDREDSEICREVFRRGILSVRDHPALSRLSVIHMASTGAVLTGGVSLDPPIFSSGRPLSSWARPGLLLYGHYPAASREIRNGWLRSPAVRPVFGVEGRLLAVRVLPRGSSVSYGRTVRLARDSRIGVLGLGYADGLPRLLSGRGWAVAAGRRLPFLGRVCMDMVAVDMTEIPTDEMPKDWVSLIAPGDPLSMTVDHLAHEAGTIPYEILCLMGHRSERRYIGGALSASDLPL